LAKLYVIVNFKEELLSKLIGLKKTCERESGWEPPSGYVEEFSKIVLGICRKDANLVKVALVDDKLVGYCISVKDLHSYEGVVFDVTWRSAYIWDFFVLKTHRKRGIGEALLNETITYLKSIGKDKVGLLVNYRNNIAKRFFENRGFKLWSRFLVKSI